MRSGQGCCHPPPGSFPNLQQIEEAQGTAQVGNTNSGLKLRSVVLKRKYLEKSIKRNPPSCFGATERHENRCPTILVGGGRTCICGL